MTIEGIVKRIIFESPDSDYKVIRILTEDDEIVVTGNMPFLELEARYEFDGELVDTTKYGVQFQSISYHKIVHNDAEGLILYLSSKQFKGIGPKLAAKIVDGLGLDCIDKIRHDPNVLESLGFKQDKIDTIYDAIIDQSKTEEIYIKLYSYGLTARMAARLYEFYGDSCINKIESNPYILIEDLEGYGFKRADTLAAKMGISTNDERRIKAGLSYVLNQACLQKGYTFLTKTQYIDTSYSILAKGHENEISKDDIERELEKMKGSNILRISGNRYYPYYLYEAEKSAANRLMQIRDYKFKAPDENEISSRLNIIEKNLGYSLTSLQYLALKRAIASKVCIITGGPGTGKTTIVKALLMLDAMLQKKEITDSEYVGQILLLAPTGKAAKRLSQSTGLPAKTIHSALGYNELGFSYDELNQLANRLIIIDESSMIDVCLLDAMLRAIPDSAQLIFVGDDNQLPSVGPGNILNEMIGSNLFVVTKLEEIMRQRKDSNIIKLSQMILQKRIDYKIFNERNEVFFYPSEAKDVLAKIEQLVNAYIKGNGDFKHDIQILAPMYSSVCGIDAINKMIQEKFNNNSVILEKNNKAYKIGDKVLQLKNEPSLGIMNGDDGIILDYEKNDEHEILYIDFGGHIVQYDVADLDNLTLGYAISIHKSQGMEFDNVIIPIVPAFYIMLKPKLIYTAFTRAKRKLIILGQTQSLNQALYQSDEGRQTSLFLKKATDEVVYIDDPEIPFDTLGEEDMENISPYSFMD